MIIGKFPNGTYGKLLQTYITHFVWYEVFHNDIFNAGLKGKKR
jgi:hypothetical protein